MSATEAPDSIDRVLVEFPATPGYRGVGRLVLGGLSSRFDLPVDRVEDFLLALESLITQELASEAVTMEAFALPGGLSARIGPFASSQVSDDGVARVLRPLVDEVAEEQAEDGYWVELQVSAGRSTGG
ncbi:MAG TPA: hypothetical protein VFR32_06565 [Gaiellaceae bacterium]|nr:hypothetical protein [Gaiellaceae bacterium]